MFWLWQKYRIVHDNLQLECRLIQCDDKKKALRIAHELRDAPEQSLVEWLDSHMEQLYDVMNPADPLFDKLSIQDGVTSWMKPAWLLESKPLLSLDEILGLMMSHNVISDDEYEQWILREDILHGFQYRLVDIDVLSYNTSVSSMLYHSRSSASASSSV